MQHPDTSIEDFEEGLKKYISGTALEGEIGYTTGIKAFDKMVGKNLPGDLIIITGRPGMGKTSFALNLASGLCERYTAKTVIYSLESNKFQIATKLVSAKCGLNKESMQINNEWVPAAKKAVDWLTGLMKSDLLKIHDKIPSTQEEFLRQYEEFLKNNTKIIFTDHLGEVPLDQKVLNRTHVLGDITRKIKHLSRDYGATSFLLHQLNRELEKRPDKRPMLSDLRDSGELEQIADKIWGLYRESYYVKTAPKDEAEILSLKGKDNATGIIKLSFSAEITTFGEKARKRHKKIVVEPL